MTQEEIITLLLDVTQDPNDYIIALKEIYDDNNGIIEFGNKDSKLYKKALAENKLIKNIKIGG